MKIYDLAVVGAGPAGMMASIRAGQLKKNVVLVERNDSLGKKIMLTGKSRCNVTNIAPIAIFIEKFGKPGNFFRSAFSVFSNQDLIDFFQSQGLQLKIERQGRVFPVTDSAYSIVKVLKECLYQNRVTVLYKMRLIDLKRKETIFHLHFENRTSIQARKVILTTGGASYKITGSTGDGFHLAKKLGHTIIPLKPGLVPLKTKELWVKELQGLTLKNIRLTFQYDKKKIVSEIGELLFTHFGVSGPLVLDLSNKIVHLLEENPEVNLFIDLKPGLEPEQLENRLLNDFRTKGNTELKNLLKNLLPQKLIPVFVNLSGLDAAKKANQINQQERSSMVNLLKAFPLTISGSLSLEEAMVTDGGISTKEINPQTMESRIIPGLYFAGEIIDGCASSGGYNLQQAFSTGYLAAERAADA